MGKIFQTYIDLDVALCYSPTNLIHQTVEAEITAMMPLQRAWIGGSQVRNTIILVHRFVNNCTNPQISERYSYFEKDVLVAWN